METDDIKFLVVHCSDTPNTENLNAKDIHKMHIGFGWDGIGYHKVILRNGILEAGRPEYWQGAHAYGYNDKSLGVCLIGKDKFTSIQFKTLENLLNSWKSRYPNAKIVGHRDITNSEKTCPNFDVKHWIKSRKKNENRK